MEIVAILVVALIVFGPKRLPEVGRQVGAALRELRRIQDTVKSELREVMAEPTPAGPGAGADNSDHAELPSHIVPDEATEPDDRGGPTAPRTFS